MKKCLLFLILLPFAGFSQNVMVKDMHPVIKQTHSTDTIKSISYPVIYTENGTPCKKINVIIRTFVFGAHADTVHLIQNLLNTFYARHRGMKISYKTNYTTNGFLSITLTVIPYNGNRNTPIYLNFDLTTGKFITLRDMLKSRNDSISFRQAVVPQVTDSVRLFEQTLDKADPVKHSKIIEDLNNTLSDFRKNYESDFILTDSEIIVCYYCFLPGSLMPYEHTYQVGFRYRALKNILKPDVLQRLQ
jgi:hypothetical protein